MELTRYEPVRCPVEPLEPRLSRILDILRNGLEGALTTRPPSAEQRAWLLARRAQIGHALVPGPTERLMVICGNLIVMFTLARRWDASGLGALTRRYAAMVDDLPAWAVAQAAGALARGRVKGQSLNYPPSPALLAHETREVLVPIRAELITITAILKAKAERR